MIHPGLTVVCTVAILAVIPGLSILYREFLDRSGVRSSALLTVTISASCFVMWLLLSLLFTDVAASQLEFPTAALAALSGFLSSLTVRDTTSKRLPAVVYSLGWTVLVFTPVVLLVLYRSAIGLGATDGPLDLGGALPVHVAVGSSALVVLTIARRWAVPDHSHIRPRSWLLLTSGAVIWAGSIFGFVGLELAVDSIVTPRIITNAIVAPVMAMIGWLIVQRIGSATTSAIGAVAGLLSGIVAISAGCAYFTPLWAGVTGVAAGIAASIFVSGRIRKTRRHAWFIVGAHLVAATIGLVMLGLFGTDFGLIYDGQIGLLQTQVVSAVAVVVWAGLVSLLLWTLIRGRAHKTAAIH